MLDPPSIDGIFSGMKTHLSPEECLEGLGDKVIEATSLAVVNTRADLAAYRIDRASWVASSSERGLANWIHDRVWAHLVNEVDHLPEVVVHDSPPIRELFISRDLNFRLRIKRHDSLGRVASFPTQGVLDFYEQGQNVGVLPGMEEWKLIAGYVWEKATHDIGPPVLSYRDGVENLVWIRELDENLPAGGVVVPTPPRTAPPSPQIRISSEPDTRIDRATAEASE